jgi:putative membrane protein
MLKILMSILINGSAVWLSARLAPGVEVGFGSALATGVLLGLVNAVVKPILIVLTLPITVMTLGLFLLVINALMILLVAWLVPGFRVDGFGTALWFSIILWVVNGVLQWLTPEPEQEAQL